MSDLVNALSGANRSSSVLSAIANPQVVNPLAAYAGAVQTARGVYDLRQQQATEAAGQAFLNSIDPATGQPNQALLMRNLQRDPATAMAAQEAAQRGQTLDADTYKLHTARLSQVADGLGTLIGRFPNGIPQEEVNAAIQRQIDTGRITPAEGQQATSLFGQDPRQNSIVATQLYSHNMSTQQQLERIYGTRQAVSSPSGTSFVTVPPAGPGQPDVSVPAGVSPEWAGTKVEWTDIHGVKQQGTNAQWATEHGLGHVTEMPHLITTAPAGGVGTTTQPPGSTPSTSAQPPPPPAGTSIKKPLPTPPVPPAAATNGATSTTQATPPATPPAPATPATPATPAAATPATPATPTGKLISTPGPAPGVVEAAQHTAEQSAAAGTALMTRADQAPINKANYANMATDLTNINTGPTSEREKAINAFLIKYSGHGLTMTPQQVASADSFAKLANIAIGQQLQAIGGTDARQALFMGSNPNLDLSKLGNEQIIHMLQGNEDAIQAKGRAWTAWKQSHGSDTYDQFQDDFNHHFDPRVFQQQYMGPPEIAALKARMTNPDGKPTGEGRKFLDDVRWAREQKWIN